MVAAPSRPSVRPGEIEKSQMASFTKIWPTWSGSGPSFRTWSTISCCLNSTRSKASVSIGAGVSVRRRLPPFANQTTIAATRTTGRSAAAAAFQRFIGRPSRLHLELPQPPQLGEFVLVRVEQIAPGVGVPELQDGAFRLPQGHDVGVGARRRAGA